IRINAPFIAPGDYFQGQVNYCVGATRYCAFTPSGAGDPGIFNGGTSLGFGWFSDGVYTGVSAAVGSAVQLTTAWSVQAAHEHFWPRAVRTSFVVGYTNIRYNDTATAFLCAGGSGGAGTIYGVTGGCTSGLWDWQHLSLSSRTQWNITKDFYIGLEGYYARLF